MWNQIYNGAFEFSVPITPLMSKSDTIEHKYKKKKLPYIFGSYFHLSFKTIITTQEIPLVDKSTLL